MEEKLEGMMVLLHACMVVVIATTTAFYRMLREFNTNKQQNVENLVFTYGSAPSPSPARTIIVVIRVKSACV